MIAFSNLPTQDKIPLFLLWQLLICILFAQRCDVLMLLLLFLVFLYALWFVCCWQLAAFFVFNTRRQHFANRWKNFLSFSVFLLILFLFYGCFCCCYRIFHIHFMKKKKSLDSYVYPFSKYLKFYNMLSVSF